MNAISPRAWAAIVMIAAMITLAAVARAEEPGTPEATAESAAKESSEAAAAPAEPAGINKNLDSMSVALQGSSYFKLPKILQWFTGNIGLHHIHHVQPSIPNYNLQQCYNEIPVLQAVNTITLKTSLRSLRLGLYDETNKKLVGFRSLVGGTSK